MTRVDFPPQPRHSPTAPASYLHQCISAPSTLHAQAERSPELIAFHKQLLGWASTTENTQISHHSLIVQPAQSAVSPAPCPRCPLLPGPVTGAEPRTPRERRGEAAPLHQGLWAANGATRSREREPALAAAPRSAKPRSDNPVLTTPFRPPRSPLPAPAVAAVQTRLRGTAQVSRDPPRALRPHPRAGRPVRGPVRAPGALAVPLRVVPAPFLGLNVTALAPPRESIRTLRRAISMFYFSLPEVGAEW